MADAKKPSLEDILAACRKADGSGDGGAAEQSPGAAAEPAAASESAKPEEPAKKPGEMSVAEMLSAARAEKAGGAKPAAEASSAEEPSAEGPAAPAGPAKKPGEMSVAEMLAAARGEKSAGKPAAASSSKPKPAAKPKAAPAATEKKSAPAKPSGPKDTASILAAARGAAKPGPVSKAEAAKAGQPLPEKPAKPAKAPVVVPPMPKKPEYAQAKPGASAAPAAEVDRRGFFSRAFDYALGTPLAIGFTTLAVTNLLWLLGLARFMFPNILTEPPTRFKVGFPTTYAPGMVETKFKAEFGVWIVNYEYEGQSQIYALKAVCTHLGCTPNWLEAEQKFKCPCHGSGFYKDGINFEGPAPRPLERYAIARADDGQLEVDKSRTFQEEMGQWADPASYVNA